MGIIGIGSDTTNIQRIEKAYAKFGERFLNRVFSAEEIKKANSRRLVSERLFASTLAKRFAAKEAFAKAIGTGFSNGVFHKNISVVNAASGKPTLVLSGGALKILQSLSNADISIDLSMSDDYPVAQAIVIISTV